MSCFREILLAALMATAAIFPFSARGEAQPDTTSTLQEVVVTARIPDDVIPAQRLDGDALRKLNSNSVADALRYFAGVQVKDYGGVGGIKTVNIRSMGTNHTGVVYDGVQLGNAQNGQIDLGQFSLDNIEAISLYNGQKSEILQPARDFGSAGSIYMRTRKPRFEEGKKFNLRTMMRFGSFDLANPSVTAEMRLSRNVNASFSAEYVYSSGKYKFRYRRSNPDGEIAYDTTAVRQNGDINSLRLEGNVYGVFNAGEWSAKVYHYNSRRGVPGAIVNNVWRRGERIWDNNNFAQGSFRKSIGGFTTLNNIKYAYYRTHYVNNDEKLIRVDNLYKQQEVYFSTSNEYAIRPWWRVSLSYDFCWNDLKSDMYDFAYPVRYTNLLALATAVNLPRFRAQFSGLGTFITDKVRNRENPRDKHVFTPALYLAGNPLRNRDFSLRFFCKQSYRMPTFNDLYYADMGNSKLDPETATQYNLGVLYDHATPAGWLRAARVSCDVYYNYIKNKIVAYPKGQQFRWTMINLGKVDIRGIDFSGLVTFNPVDSFLITLRAQYTYQKAIDITDPTDSYYRDQIPYIPWHSGAAVVNLDWRGWNFNYSFIYVGERYNQQENIIYNYTQPWYTSDISLSKDFRIKKVKCRILAEVNNLLSQDYDVILNYPMPKRNYRFSLVVEI